jgi:NitT/TauT family transport system permease protein
VTTASAATTAIPRARSAGGAQSRRAGRRRLRGLVNPLIGIGILLALWWLGGYLIASNPATASFAGFAPLPTLGQLADLIAEGGLWQMVAPSLRRILGGLAWAIAIGVPFGVAIGRVAAVREIAHVPFQFLRMISPLSWMPIAILVFASWDGAIVFLIFAAAVWPITFATANGISKIDPSWFKVARNLGARGWQMLFAIILPAVAQDVLTGVRLALGVAWVVLVPAEYLGVTSGLGYAINDARDTLEYDRLAAIVVVIGAIGFALDWICLALIRRYSWVEET